MEAHLAQKLVKNTLILNEYFTAFKLTEWIVQMIRPQYDFLFPSLASALLFPSLSPRRRKFPLLSMSVKKSMESRVVAGQSKVKANYFKYCWISISGISMPRLRPHIPAYFFSSMTNLPGSFLVAVVVAIVVFIRLLFLLLLLLVIFYCRCCCFCCYCCCCSLVALGA